MLYDTSAACVTSRSHILLLNQVASKGDSGGNAARPGQGCGLTFASVNGTISSCVSGNQTCFTQPIRWCLCLNPNQSRSTAELPPHTSEN